MATRGIKLVVIGDGGAFFLFFLPLSSLLSSSFSLLLSPSFSLLPREKEENEKNRAKNDFFSLFPE
jgi:hypothetical protein